MRAREIYGRYRRDFLALAAQAAADPAWRRALDAKVSELKREVSGLDQASRDEIRKDLCDQLELAMHGAGNPAAREALAAALKCLELDVFAISS